MQYFISFLEGIITFISPCLLPMLPIYVSYFAGGEASSDKGTKRVVANALCFIFGFTAVFVLMGAFAGFFGSLLSDYKTLVNIITGVIVIIFGLNFLGALKLNIFKGMHGAKTKNLGPVSSFIFGIIFSIGWTPCVGAFLGSALMLAASGQSMSQGIVMLLLYSLGLGIPFFISAVLIDKVKYTFDFIKKHYRIINLISGSLLVVVGILMATGLFGRFISLMS